ncbi:MAG: alpha/beta fold hydrolase [Candidatus Aminicenantaceae bacterium]
MLDEQKLLEALKDSPEKELDRFKAFLDSHTLTEFAGSKGAVPYYMCGEGPKTLMTFAGGWGGPQLLYDTILGFEGGNRVIVIDISTFNEPDAMTSGVNQVLDHEQIDKVVLIGQSASGITAQAYFKRSPDRVEGMVLTNTLAPRIERCKKWALGLLQVIPISLMKALARKKLLKLGEFEKEVAPEVQERRCFAGALFGAMMDHYFTRRNITNMLKLAYAFNERDAYTQGEFQGWQGHVLLVTSEDEPYYPDVELLQSGLPNTEVFLLPTGFKHVAPQIHRDEFQARIQAFIDAL